MNVPGPSPRKRGARERFARAVDHGASHLDDQEFTDELAVVSALRSAGRDVEPGERARARIASRIAEGDREPEQVPEPVPAAVSVAVAEKPTARIPLPRSPEPEPARPKRRLSTVLAAAVGLVLALAGLGSALSTDSLPGDLLYQVKRAQESAVLQLTLDDEDRARQRLEYASDRLVELARLADRAEPGSEQHGFRATLADFGSDTRVAVSQLTTLATTSDGSQLDLLRDWVATQSDRLADLRAALPASLAEERARTASLLRDVDARAAALSDRMDCYQITSGQSDELGVLPSEKACRSQPVSETGVSAAPEPASNGPGGTGAGDRTGGTQPETGVTTGPTHPSDEPARTTEPSTAPVPVTPDHAPQQWLPAPPAASVSRPRLPDSVPEPPVRLSIPPVLPGLPGIGLG